MTTSGQENAAFLLGITRDWQGRALESSPRVSTKSVSNNTESRRVPHQVIFEEGGRAISITGCEDDDRPSAELRGSRIPDAIGGNDSGAAGSFLPLSVTGYS